MQILMAGMPTVASAEERYLLRNAQVLEIMVRALIFVNLQRQPVSNSATVAGTRVNT
ncbi:MAG: hypothetical protein ABI444_14390 [Candidatus Kapaibacterium sp.]